jgi:hypothetical protein
VTLPRPWLIALVAVGLEAPTCYRTLDAQDSTLAPVVRLEIAPQAWRYLRLSYLRYGNHEFLGCMLGHRVGDTVWVRGIGPADVQAAPNDSTTVRADQTCAVQGWQGVIGTIHSHTEPVGPSCSHWYRGLQVWTTDMAAFVYGPYPIAAIFCGNRIVWINRDKAEYTMGIPDSTAGRRTTPPFAKDSAR